MKRKLKIVVGMSGGVDSSVAAYLLKKQGHDVIGLFMKNWEETDDSGTCTAEKDFADVKRVCETLDIPYYTVNFSKQYMENVFQVFLDGLENGITPNPDILCNREIKFGPFLDYAKKLGADCIATGHYCRVKRVHMAEERSDDMPCAGGIQDKTTPSKVQLLKAVDLTKDQSYFLCGLKQEQLSQVLFPLGEYKKTEVRQIATKLGLVTKDKPDSTGICFIGERNFRNFMKTYLGNQPGEIQTLDGKTVGKHEGLMYYTIGQRKGLGIGGMRDAEPNKWFVISKDLKSNILYVSQDENDLLSTELIANDFNWIGGVWNGTTNLTAKTRYRQPDQKCTIEILGNNVKVMFEKPQRAVTPGQWVVLYNGDVCLGGGQIMEVK